MPPLWKTICHCLKALQIDILLAFPFLGGTQTGLSAHIYIFIIIKLIRMTTCSSLEDW